MNSSYIIIAAFFFFYFFGYRYYARRIERELVNPGDNETPAFSKRDGVDYVPAKKSILFGHHFASIAGAGPIIGPIVALVNFGWLAALAWIAVGNVFIGAVHDYLTLMLSVRNKGVSVADIADRAMGRRAKNIFSIFLYLALVLVVTVFGMVGANTLVAQPGMVIPTFALVPVAIIFGWAVYVRNVPLLPATIVVVAINAMAIYIGYHNPVAFPKEGIGGISPINIWFAILMIYAALASVLPVNILLQPRDYIATFNLYLAMLIGFAAILFVRPEMNAPPVVTVFSESKGPIWPMLFVLVACGAVSGFHCLVSSGTTSKQLSCEKDGKAIAFGGMLFEGFLAVMTLVLVGAGLYWTPPLDGNTDMVRYGIREVMTSGGWVVAFGNGFGSIVSQMLPFLGFSIASMIAMTALKTFILTTLDSSTRIARFIIEESVGRKVPVFSNKYIALLLVIVPSYVLGISSGYTKIWPIFGATNQLIAALALMVVSSYLVGVKKPLKYTLIPALFMIITTIAALLWQAFNFYSGDSPDYFLGNLSLILVALALFVGYEGLSVFLNLEKNEEAIAEA
ncbi:MAG: carbon starvation protein A [Deltaproteobacteria bacterium]|nr:carbon starvation protein A [Deltaproteobacteria bacterium]